MLRRVQGRDDWRLVYGGIWSAGEEWQQACVRDCDDGFGFARRGHLLSNTSQVSHLSSNLIIQRHLISHSSDFNSQWDVKCSKKSWQLLGKISSESQALSFFTEQPKPFKSDAALTPDQSWPELWAQKCPVIVYSATLWTRPVAWNQPAKVNIIVFCLISC